MKSDSAEIARYLLKFIDLNQLRIKSYRHAVAKAGNKFSKIKLSEKVKKIINFNEELRKISEEYQLTGQIEPAINLEQLLSAQFYYSIAQKSEHPQVILLSCQLGDECTIKVYKEVLSSERIDLPAKIRDVLIDHITNLEEPLFATQQYIFGMVYN